LKQSGGKMRANRTLEMPTRTVPAEGLVMARVGARGRWAALRALHGAMADVRRLRGDDVRLAFIVALASDGRIVAGRDPDAAVFLLGYRATQE
jgi:hypothetical protein